MSVRGAFCGQLPDALFWLIDLYFKLMLAGENDLMYICYSTVFVLQAEHILCKNLLQILESERQDKGATLESEELNALSDLLAAGGSESWLFTRQFVMVVSALTGCLM